ncbi:hypothetical protein [Rhodococcus marinonascens]|uniref:hypothetical protein n=1 Tax=Rhodococcus marinonascens TaxID=38311 RepID=UPI000A50901F|nr:hypothetical protein [Rhodococcus marinonascens]
MYERGHGGHYRRRARHDTLATRIYGPGSSQLLVHDSLSTDQQARISFDQFIPTGSYTATDLRADLIRVLLGVDVR